MKKPRSLLPPPQTLLSSDQPRVSRLSSDAPRSEPPSSGSSGERERDRVAHESSDAALLLLRLRLRG